MPAYRSTHHHRRTALRAFQAATLLASVGAVPAARAQDIVLTGVVRDFKPSFYAGGHEDFEQVDPTMVDKKYIAYLVEPVIGDDGKPVFNAGGWKPHNTGTTLRIQDVDFLDLFNGWAVGLAGPLGGLILHTDDAGKSWSLQTSGTTAAVLAVSMVDELSGWVVTAAGELLNTTDGGATWVNRTPFPFAPAQLNDVQFLDANNGFVVGAQGFFARTTDGGTNWTIPVSSIAPPPATTPNFQNVCFLNTWTGFAVGSGPVILWTNTAGNSWSQMTLPALPAGTVLHDICFPTPATGYAVGSGGTILKSVNSGANWSAQASGLVVQLNAVEFPLPAALEGWVVGNGGHVLHTADGGTTWSDSPLGTTNFFDVACPTDKYSFIAGGGGTLYRYDPPPTIVRSVWQGGGKRLAETMYRSHTTDWSALLGNSGVGSINSATSFRGWFEDQPGVNLSANLNITLQRQMDGSLWFSSRTQAPYVPYPGAGSFFPIDNALLGNPPWPYVPGAPDHNFNFTWEMHGAFEYHKATSPSVYVFSDDDIWLFIDGKLCLSMAGVHWGQFQEVDINRLRLKDNKKYRFDFFYAERQCCEAHLEMRVNFDVVPYAPTTISNVFD